MKLQNITLRLYYNAEFVQFLSGILSIIQHNAIAQPQVIALLAEMAPQVQLLGRHIAPQRKKPLTDELAALDRRRDAAIQGIAYLAKAHTYHYTPARVDAAKVLLRQLKMYRGNIAYQNRMAQSANITDFIRDCAQPKLAAAIAQLGLAPWMAELEAANTAYEDCFMSRIQAIAAQPKVQVKLLRTQCTKQYRQLCNLLQAQHIITDGAEPYNSTIAQCNALIKQYKQLMLVRKEKSVTE